MDVRLVRATGLALSAPLVAIAWRQGYHTGNALAAVAIPAAVWWLASVLVSRLLRPAGAAVALVRTAVVAVAIAVGTGFVLDGLHAISLLGYAIAAAVSAAVAAALQWSRPPATVPGWERPPGLSVPALAILGALLALILGFAATHAPFTLYDAVSYHLYFAGRWLQDHAISILPTPFSDPSQAYEPANGELFLVWLMAPWHGDFAARAGQVPFWLLAGVAVVAIARRLGASRAHALYPALFLLIARGVVEQAVGADVDLIGLALFAAAVALGLVAVDRDTRADWAVWGIAVGLTLGTKYLLLLYVPLILTMAVANGLRWRALWALPGLLVFGASWYVRNWVIAGSPIYPASLMIAGRTIAAGAYTRAAMTNSVFHMTNLRYAPAIIAHGVGLAVVVAVWPMALVGLVRLLRRGWWPAIWLGLLPLAMALMFWFQLADNVDGRFLLPAFGPALVPVAFVFGAHRGWNAAMHALCLGVAAWGLIGAPYEIPLHGPWFMGGWFELNGVVSPNSVALAAGLVLVFGFAWGLVWLAAGRSRWVVPVMALLIGSTGTVLALGEDTQCAPGPCERLHVSDPYIRVGLRDAWAWMDDHVRDATVAYTGINLPYPLAGAHLTNRVVYVNIDGHPGWRLDDYDRAYRAGRFAPVPPALAIPSGELEPVPARPGPRDDASRPRYERLDGVSALWTRNLDLARVTDVFIARLSAYEVDVQTHGPEGFPIEDAWAQADPARFRVIFSNGEAHIYAVARAADPR